MPDQPSLPSAEVAVSLKVPLRVPPARNEDRPANRRSGVAILRNPTVRHRCYTRDVPTRRRRHAITETPPVQAALDELREALGDDRVEMGELVILGAQEKLSRVRAERDDTAVLRRRLADRIRSRDVPVDRAAADEVRRAGWVRP
jgi:hypothetical protein